MKYICTGRVQPERAGVGFGPIRMELDGGGNAVTSCDSSQITVLLDVAHLDGCVSARILSIDVANIVVGSLGFVFGCGYSVDMIQVTEEDGAAYVFGVQPEGKTLALAPAELSLPRAVHLAGKSIYFRQAVRDYLRAMTMDKDCGGYCFRAIESIRSAFGTDSAGWAAMHGALGTNRELIDRKVKDFADDVRHGNWKEAPSTNSAQRWEMLSITRDVLVKYLDYSEPDT